MEEPDSTGINLGHGLIVVYAIDPIFSRLLSVIESLQYGTNPEWLDDNHPLFPWIVGLVNQLG